MKDFPLFSARTREHRVVFRAFSHRLRESIINDAPPLARPAKRSKAFKRPAVPQIRLAVQ